MMRASHLLSCLPMLILHRASREILENRHQISFLSCLSPLMENNFRPSRWLWPTRPLLHLPPPVTLTSSPMALPLARFTSSPMALLISHGSPPCSFHISLFAAPYPCPTHSCLRAFARILMIFPGLTPSLYWDHFQITPSLTLLKQHSLTCPSLSLLLFSFKH